VEEIMAKGISAQKTTRIRLVAMREARRIDIDGNIEYLAV